MLAVSEAIVGRRQELDVVESILDGSGPAALVVRGEPGIGKSTLVEAAIASAEARGLRVLSCRPASAELQLSFAAVTDLFAPVAADILPRLPPPQAEALRIAMLLADPRAGEQVDRRATAMGAHELLRLCAAESNGLLVAVDDAQWLDAASAFVLGFALRRLRDVPLTVLVAERRGDEDDESALAASLIAEGAQALEVGPLSVGAINALLRERLQIVLRRPTLLRVHQTSAGNPFYALELARALQRDNEVESLDDARLPSSLRALLRARVDALPEPTLELLLVAAALGAPTTSLLAGAVETDDVERDLHPAVAGGVVRVREHRVLFTHPLLAAAAYARASTEHRQAVHRRLAGLVTREEERARHLALASTDADDANAAIVEKGARAASARGAFEAAAELAVHAVRLTPVDEHDRLRERLTLAAESLLLAGDYERGRTFWAELVKAAAPGAERAGALLRLAQFPRDLAESRRLSEEALAEASGAPLVQADVHAFLAQLAYNTEGARPALEHGRQAVELAERNGDEARAVRARATVAFFAGTAGEGFDFRALRAAAELEDVQQAYATVDDFAWMLGVALGWTEQVGAAREHFSRVLERERTGASAAILAMAEVAKASIRHGEVEAGLQQANEAIELAQQFGLRTLEDAGWAARANAEVVLGRIDDARQSVERFLAGAKVANEGLGWIRGELVLALIDLSTGDFGAASKHYTALLQRLDERGIVDPGVWPVHAHAVDAFVGAGELDEAELVTASLERLAESLGRPQVRAWALRCRGLVALGRGEIDAAIAALEAACVANEASPLPFEQTRNLLALGTALRHANRRREAREVLEEALARFEQLGAALWAEKARSELHSVGGRRRTSDELTPTEERVATLAASGKTNKEIAAALVISVKTVEGHLSRVYGKLGVRSRAELARSFRGLA